MRAYTGVYESIRKEIPPEILNIRNHMVFLLAEDTPFKNGQGRRETAATADRSRSDNKKAVFLSKTVHKFSYNQLFVHAVDVGDTASVDKTSTAGSVNTAIKPETRRSSEDVAVIDEEHEEGGSCDSFLPCDPRRWMHRYLMLGFMCMLSFGSYYVYDNPTALQSTILKVR